MRKSVFRKPLIAGFALLAAVPAQADVKAGVDAWTGGNYDRAIREWRGPAEQGDADAQFNMGQAYKLGRGVPQDLRKAEEMFAKAAAQGHFQAADNYGLLLFQRGERQRAMPFIGAAAERGDPRAQYLLGIAYFNGDNVGKDWVRAYALVSLAQQGGLAAAAPALAQMDQYIPLEQRQASVALASELASQAENTRARQLAAVDLANTVESRPAALAPSPAQPPLVTAQLPPGVASAPPRATMAPQEDRGPRTAGADYARPHPPVAVATPRPSAPSIVQRPVAPQASAVVARTAPTGGWRVQLGAFGQAANAEAAWNRAKGQAALSGHGRLLVSAGSVTKLQAGGFASHDHAQAACDQLATAGFDCIPVRP